MEYVFIRKPSLSVSVLRFSQIPLAKLRENPYFISFRWNSWEMKTNQRLSKDLCFSRIILVLDAKKCFINNLWKFSLTRMSRLAILTLSESNVVLPFKRICSESLREWCSSGVDNSTKLNNALQLMSTTCLPQMPCKVWDSQRSLLQQNFRHTSWTMRKIIYGFLNIMA